MADLFEGWDHNAFMILGLLNTLTNAGILPEKERDDIIKLGETIKGNALGKETDEQVKAARELVKKLKQLNSESNVIIST